MTRQEESRSGSRVRASHSDSVANPQIICLLWRPSGSIIRDGGFRRTYAILESLPDNVAVTLVDRDPSPMRASNRYRVIEYVIPKWIHLLAGRGVTLVGLLEAVVAFSLLLLRGGQALYRSRSGIVYVPTSEIPWVTFAAAVLAKLFQSRLVLTNQNVRTGLAKKAGGLVGQILWRIHSQADQVIAVSSAIADELESVGVSGNVSINTNGFRRPDYAAIRRVAPPHGGIFIGRVELAKGVNDLLDTWLLVSRDFPRAELRLVGYASSANRARFVERRSSLGLDHLVRLLGVVPDEAKWRLLVESRVCVFLSHIEGWGFVPIEALSLGLPVIVYDLPCYMESLAGLHGVFRVAVGDTEAAAKHAAKLLAMSDDEYLALSGTIRSSFHYPDWSQIATAELALISGKAVG